VADARGGELEEQPIPFAGRRRDAHDLRARSRCGGTAGDLHGKPIVHPQHADHDHAGSLADAAGTNGSCTWLPESAD
jgi:hypothetical protein